MKESQQASASEIGDLGSAQDMILDSLPRSQRQKEYQSGVAVNPIFQAFRISMSISMQLQIEKNHQT